MLGIVIAVSAVMLLGGPYYYALSKIIWAHMFFAYKGRGSINSADGQHRS